MVSLALNVAAFLFLAFVGFCTLVIAAKVTVIFLDWIGGGVAEVVRYLHRRRTLFFIAFAISAVLILVGVALRISGVLPLR